MPSGPGESLTVFMYRSEYNEQCEGSVDLNWNPVEKVTALVDGSSGRLVLMFISFYYEQAESLHG